MNDESITPPPTEEMLEAQRQAELAAQQEQEASEGEGALQEVTETPQVVGEGPELGQEQEDEKPNLPEPGQIKD